MSRNVGYNLLPLDRYDTTGAYNSVEYRGKEGYHEDINLSDRNRPYLSGETIKSRLVKNDSNTTLAAGVALKYVAAEWGWGVQIAGAGDTPCGVVPWYMPAAVPDEAWFPMIVHGPATVQKAAGTFSEGAFMVTAASGRIDDETAGDYTNDKSEVGMALETSSGSAGTGQRVFVNLDR